LTLFDLSATRDCQDPLRRELDALCVALELDHAAYAGVSTLDQSVHAVATYPDAWKQHYLEQNLYQHDPTLRHAMRSQAPIQWSRLTRDPGFKNVFFQAQDFSISATGVTIPVRGRFGDLGMLSVTRTCSPQDWARQCQQIMVHLQEWSAVVHDTVMHDGSIAKSIQRPVLSAREIEVLQWIAAGKSQDDVGDILTISARTVEVHVRAVRHKLNALNTPQAVARAVGLGLIYPL
jgi:DNA-binding CsgD family transcriptional regulator